MQTVYPKPNRLIILGDVHGDVEKLAVCLFNYGIINEHQEWVVQPPDTIVVQLGDQVDSALRIIGGPEPDAWERYPDIEVIYFLDRLDKRAREQGGRFISMIGNHEVMNSMGDFHMASKTSIDMVGGIERRQHLFAPGGEVAQLLSMRPAVIKVGDILMCHAGLLTKHLMAVNGDVHRINAIISDYFAGRPVDPHLFQTLFVDNDSIVWTRAYSALSEDELAPDIAHVLRVCGAGRVVVGHTVVPQIMSRLNETVWFADVGYSRAFGNNALQLIDTGQGPGPVPRPLRGAAPLEIYGG